MALLRLHLEDKENIKNFNGEDLRQIFLKSGFQEKMEIIDKIISEIFNVKYILDKDTKTLFELFYEFGLRDEDDKKKLSKMIVILKCHHANAQKIPITDIQKKTVEKFNKNEVFQLFIQEIKPIDDDQALTWLSYLENGGIHGKSLLLLPEEQLIKDLNLRVGQIPVFKYLMMKIKEDEKTLGQSNINISGNATVGATVTAPGNHHFQDININAPGNR